jgi:protocatechuate 3,4-dioxygenase beta subunit
MRQNARFVLTLVLVLATVIAIWWYLFRPESVTPLEPSTARDETVRESTKLPPPAAPARPDKAAQRVDGGAVGTRVAVDRLAATRAITGGATLAGLVLDEALEPAPGVEVVIRRTASEKNTAVSDTPQTVTTGKNGTFAADGLPFGSYSLLATRGNLAAVYDAQTGPLQLGNNDITLQLRPAHSLAGRISNTQGEPVAGAEVTVLYLPPMGLIRQQGRPGSPEKAARALPLVAQSEDQGTFEFERVPVSRALVAVKAEGYAPYISELIQLPAAGVAITLGVGGSLAGRVLQADTGEPVSGFALRVSGPTMADAHEAVTNDSGEYECAGLRPGEYTIAPADTLWVNSGPAPRVKLSLDEQRTGLELRVTQAGIIRGRVYDEETGAGIPGAAVILRPALMGYGASVNTDNNGAYEMPGVPPGEHSLALRVKDRCISNPYIEQEMALVSLKAGELLEGIDLPVFMGTTISGQVQNADGTPAPCATVNVIPAMDYNRTQVMAGQDGTFAVSGVTNGEHFRLQASKGTQTSAPTDTLQVPVSGGLEGVVLTLQEGGVIGGTVVTPSGIPLAGMGVLLGREGIMSFQPGYTVTDEAGRFLAAGLAPGLYTLTAMTQGEQGGPDSAAKVELAAAQRVDHVILTWSKKPPALGPEGNLSISGQVVDGAGKPVSDALVYAIPDGSNTNYTTKSLWDGVFSVSGLAPGSY